MKIQDIENHKQLSDHELNRDLRNLINGQAFAGNPFLYHFQLKNLMKAKREGGNTLYEIYDDKTAWAKLLSDTSKRGRMGPSAASNVFECHRINHGSIVMFKAQTAINYIPECDTEENLVQQLGQNSKKKGADKIYVWKV